MKNGLMLDTTQLDHIAEHHRPREISFFGVLNELALLNPEPPSELCERNRATEIDFDTLFEMTGGYLTQNPTLPPPQNRTIYIRAYKNADIATRASTKKKTYPNTIFINTAHVEDPYLLTSLREGYGDAARQLARSDIADHFISPVLLYGQLEGNADVRTVYRLTFREELFHLKQEDTGVDANMKRIELSVHPDVPYFMRHILGKSQMELRKKRKAGTETPFDRFERRLNYLWKDREFQAKLDKVFCEYGRTPNDMRDALRIFDDIGLATGGYQSLRATDLMEASYIHGKPSRALAELNFALVSVFPHGVPQRIMTQVIAYHLGHVMRLNGDADAMLKMGFESVRVPVRNSNGAAVKGKFATHWRPLRHPLPA